MFKCKCKIKFRVVALLDVDCFEVQVRGKYAGINPERLQNDPFAVEVNFITCANQPARDCGVVRGPSNRNQNVNPHHNLNVLPTPYVYGKPENLSMRKAGDDIYDCILSTLNEIENYNYCNVCGREVHKPIMVVEKANCDEFYIDLTNKIYDRMSRSRYNCNIDPYKLINAYRNFRAELFGKTIEKYDNMAFWGLFQKVRSMGHGHDEQVALLYGAEIITKVLNDVRRKLGYVISAGVAGNKLLSKLACHLSKPNGLAVLDLQSFKVRLKDEIPFTKIPGLGGQTGERIQMKYRRIQTIGDFQRAFFKLRLWKWLKCDPTFNFERLYGIDRTPVVPKNLLDKITCGKTLNTNPGNRASTKDDFIFHLNNRFHEMRDNLLYEYDRRGRRTPVSLKLEIFEHSCTGSRHAVFRYQTDFPRFLMENFMWWRSMSFKEDESLEEWKPLLGEFKTQINERAEIPLFCNSGSYISGLCRINLIAYFYF